MPTPAPIARTFFPHLDVQRVRSLRGECDVGAGRFKHTGRVDPPACGPRGHLVLRARAKLHPRLVRQGVVERVEKFLTCRTRFAPWKLSLIPRMPGASGRTPTSLRCRCGPGEWRGCPASGGFGAWRNHSEYRHSQRVSFPIVTDAARVFPFPDGPRERCGPATRWTEASPRVLMSLGSNCSTQEAQSKGLRHTSRASGSVRVQSPPTSHQGPWPPNRCVPLGSFLLTNHQSMATENCTLLASENLTLREERSRAPRTFSR